MRASSGLPLAGAGSRDRPATAGSAEQCCGQRPQEQLSQNADPAMLGVAQSLEVAADDLKYVSPTTIVLEHKPRAIAQDVALLSLCYCLGMGSMFASVSIVSLAVAERVSPSLALVPLALQKLVQTVTAFPGARHKTKRGFASAAAVGALGYAISAAAVAFVSDPGSSFAMLCSGYCLSGVSDPFVQFLRFAAGDIAPASYKPRAISYVLAGGSVAALAGPELARLLVDSIPERRFAGSYVGASLLLVLEMLIILAIDFSPSTVVLSAEAGAVSVASAAQATVAQTQTAPIRSGTAQPAAPTDRSVSRMIWSPGFVLVSTTAATVQLTMISPMQILPLAMERNGFGLDFSARVIQAHILGMYVPSFCTGHLVGTVGKRKMMLVGLTVNLVAMVSLLIDPSEFWIYLGSLTVIGVGWNWGFVGATSLLAQLLQEHPRPARAAAEGANDLIVQLVGALGTAATGFAVAGLGWKPLVGANAALLAAQLVVVLVLGVGRGGDVQSG